VNISKTAVDLGFDGQYLPLITTPTRKEQKK